MDVAATRKKALPSKAVDEAIRETLDAAKEVKDTWESVARPGVIFKLRKFSTMLIAEMSHKIAAPQVPNIYIKDDDRWEPNPNDPVYLEAVREYNYTLSLMFIDAHIVMGTEVLKLPEGYQKHTDEEWVEQLEAVGLDITWRDDKFTRYKSWVKFYALDDDEVPDLYRAARRFNGGVIEAEVDEAAERLKSDEGLGTDTKVPEAEVG